VQESQHGSAPTLHAAALAYARRGVPVFPCERGAKRPLTRNGHWDATTDPRIIERWWQRWPCANVGVPTGKKSDLVLSSRFKPKYVSSFPLIPAIFHRGFIGMGYDGQ
jgi:hypothetical protein